MESSMMMQPGTSVKPGRGNSPSRPNPRIEASWGEALAEEFSAPYFADLKGFLQEEKNSGQILFPPGSQIFEAFNRTPVHQVKVVILGQDPYHGPGQAHGLSFSVPKGIRPPPSLANIYKELATDVGFQIPSHGDLSSWADQGVLLLNTSLTVRQGQAASHKGKGWERFTAAAIRHLAEQRRHLVFLLWGRHAADQAQGIDASRHALFKAPHPSPLSAYTGFFGCQHFSRANQYLAEHGLAPIHWQL
jgi:uracil-DNA glycosylase